MVSFAVSVLLGMFCNTTASEFTKTREQFSTGATCIVDAGWTKLPKKIYDESEMSHSWAVVFLTFNLVGLVVGSTYFLYALKVIGKTRTGSSPSRSSHRY